MQDNKKLVFPSTKMLPMDDIANEMLIIHGFQKKSEKAVDVRYVAEVVAENIAKAALDEDGNKIEYLNEFGEVIISGRDTVKNSLNLAGKPASDYLTKIDGQKIENFGDSVAQMYSDEISALRDELYQLRGELTRNGFVNEYGIYSGFQDFFKTSDKKYVHRKIMQDGVLVDTIELCGLSQNFVNDTNVNKIIPSVSGIIKVGDWFIISKTDTGENYLVKATNVEQTTSEEEITFESSISVEGIPSIENRDAVIITKVQGDYFSGTFSFSKIEKHALTNKEKYAMMNDDSNPSMEKIIGDQTGYAATFKVPQTVAGALKSFSIMTRISGSPGALVCYIVEENNMHLIKDISKEEVGAGKTVISKSQPISCLESSTVNILETTFNFIDPIKYDYPIIYGDRRYCFVIVAEKANTMDYWEVQFSKNATGSISPDLQTNNSSYSYASTTGLTLKSPIGDLVYILNTIMVENDSETPMLEGLYTTERISVKNNSMLARARVTMRISKEGNLKTETVGTVNDNGIVRAKVTGINPENLGIKSNDTIVIGREIRKAMYDVTNKNIAIDKAISVEYDSDIYRVGHKVFMRAMKREWVPGASPGYEIKREILLPMELVAVMPDRKSINSSQSERLVFECEFREEGGLPIDLNEFQAQIVWKSNVSKDDMLSNDSYIGRIYDLTISFDRIL